MQLSFSKGSLSLWESLRTCIDLGLGALLPKRLTFIKRTLKEMYRFGPCNSPSQKVHFHYGNPWRNVLTWAMELSFPNGSLSLRESLRKCIDLGHAALVLKRLFSLEDSLEVRKQLQNPKNPKQSKGVCRNHWKTSVNSKTKKNDISETS